LKRSGTVAANVGGDAPLLTVSDVFRDDSLQTSVIDSQKISSLALGTKQNGGVSEIGQAVGDADCLLTNARPFEEVALNALRTSQF
jgi:hypothetical protein